MKRYFISILLILAILVPIKAINSSYPKREVRAVWLTTLNGLDWPQTKARNAETIRLQQQELMEILNKLQAAHFNTVILQTRVRSTVIYPSAIEPWDECLTGQADHDPGYDPLAFAISECHKRKMELHAWVVAFPGHKFPAANRLKNEAMQKRVPSLCIKTADSWMLNPGEPATATYLASICSEIVQNYDVDGIHLDYIRYPEKEIRFSDAATYRKYGHKQDIKSWRRDNVTRCVKAIHDAIKTRKPWVRFSCSPVGKADDLSRYSSRGWNAFSAVCQDAQGWLKDGLMDMLVPMMYFQGDHFFPFAADWVENASGRIIVPGLGAYMLAPNQKDWPLSVVERENNFIRSIGAGGQAYFRSRFVTDDTKGLYTFLKNKFYDYPALTPALSWEKHEKVLSPTAGNIIQTGNCLQLSWSRSSQSDVTYNLYRSYTYPVDVEKACNIVDYKLTETTFLQPLMPDSYMPYYAVTIADRYGNESEPFALNKPNLQGERSVYCTNRLLLQDSLIILPQANRNDVVVLSDATQKDIKTVKYSGKLNAKGLSQGFYSVRIITKKEGTHFLGHIIVKD